MRPPVIRDIGDLLHLQLSVRVDDALAPETEARCRALTELLDPIGVPRLSSTGGGLPEPRATAPF